MIAGLGDVLEKKMKQMREFVLTLVVVLMSSSFLFQATGEAAVKYDEIMMRSPDEEPIGTRTHTFTDRDGEVTVTVEWLRRPGEFAVAIDYYGYLTQEGMANCYLSINGISRDFITLKEETPARHQRIRILSFHPSLAGKSGRGLRPLGPGELVDYLLFRNAPYYPQFGRFEIEMKFFANGRWDGDGNNSDNNYKIAFDCPLDMPAQDHF